MPAVLSKAPDTHAPSGERGGARLPARRPPGPEVSPLVPLVLQRKAHCACGGGCPRCQSAAASGLMIGAADDHYEQEADRIAAHVMGTSDVGARPSPAEPRAQRKCAKCEDDDERETLRTKPDLSAAASRRDARAAGAAAASIVQRVAHSPGQPLDDHARAFFEPRFAENFGHVRIHADRDAATAASAVEATAYTLGRDIVFASGAYVPATMEGKRLLAHELVHVVQQGGGSGATPANHAVLQRQPGPGGDEPEEPPLTRPQEIALSRTSPGEFTGIPHPLTLSLYNFGIDVAQPKAEHQAVLTELGHFLHATTSVQTVVRSVGFADSTGDERYNLDLSRRRAVAIKAFLDPLITQRVSIAAHGETNPVATNETVAGRSRNRRVDIRFMVDTPIPPQPPPRPRPVPPGPVPTPVPQPPVPIPPGGGGGQDDHHFCLDYPLICGIGVLPFLLPLICVVAPEICLAVTCVLAPELCIIPPPVPPGTTDPPEHDDDGTPIVYFRPMVRASNTPVGMNDRIGLRDAVHVMAIVLNQPPATSPITIVVDGAGANGGDASINGQAQVQITGTTDLEILGTHMSAENYVFSPFLQLAAWWGSHLAGESNRFAVSSIVENWSVVLAGANRGPHGWVFMADMPWESDSGAFTDLDACLQVELVGVAEERGGMIGMGTGGVNDPANADTGEFPPAFDEHGTPFHYTRVAGYSRLNQLFRIRDRRSNSNWAPSPNSGFTIERDFARDPANPHCWHLMVRKKGADVTINGMSAAAGAGDISHEFQHINCDPPPPPPPPRPPPPPPGHEEPQDDPTPTPTPHDDPTPPGPPPCDREELSRRVDQCIEQAKQDAIDCTLGLVTFSGGIEGILESLDYLGCLEDLKRRLLECDRRAKADTNCPDSPPPRPPDPPSGGPRIA